MKISIKSDTKIDSEQLQKLQSALADSEALFVAEHRKLLNERYERMRLKIKYSELTPRQRLKHHIAARERMIAQYTMNMLIHRKSYGIEAPAVHQALQTETAAPTHRAALPIYSSSSE